MPTVTRGPPSERGELLVPVGGNASIEADHQAAVQAAPAIEQFAGQTRCQEGKRQNLLNVPRGDTCFRGDLSVGKRRTLLEPGAPLVCPANRLQQYRIGSCPSVVEDNGTIAMGKFGSHDDGSAFPFFISSRAVGDGLHDLDTVRMHHNAINPLAQQLRGGPWSAIAAGSHSLLHEPLDFFGRDASDRTGTCFVVLQPGLADIVVISLTIAFGCIARAHRVAPVVEQSPGKGAASWGDGAPLSRSTFFGQ